MSDKKRVQVISRKRERERKKRERERYIGKREGEKCDR
jgi:hypothetical protein